MGLVLQHGVVWVRLLLQVRVVSQVWLHERARTVASFKSTRALSVAARAELEQRTRRPRKCRVHHGCKSRTVMLKGW